MKFNQLKEDEEERENLIIMKLSESKSDSSLIASICKSINHNYRRLSNTSSLLHRIPDMEISFMNMNDEYDIEKTIAEGCFAKILLAHHRPTNSTVVLKAIHTELMTIKEFIKEFHYNYQLSHHPNILSCYQVKFQTNEYYVYAQEHAPFGDLAGNVAANGLPETCCKRIAEQLSSALGFMHLKNLVHRDIKLENVLVFTPDFSRIKLCDFGATTREGVLVNKTNNTWLSFLPPEVLEVVKNERFICKSSSDSWQFGILLYVCLTGSTPWTSADWVRDNKYSAFMKYQKRETTKIPENFRKFTPRLLRAFRRIFDNNEDERAKVSDIMKYMKNKWLDPKISQSKSTSSILNLSQNQQEFGGKSGGGGFEGQQQTSDQDSIKYINHRESRNSFDNGKTRIKRLASSFGILETATIDQDSTKNRVWQWLESNDMNRHDSVEELNDLPGHKKTSDKHQHHYNTPHSHSLSHTPQHSSTSAGGLVAVNRQISLNQKQSTSTAMQQQKQIQQKQMTSSSFKQQHPLQHSQSRSGPQPLVRRQSLQVSPMRK